MMKITIFLLRHLLSIDHWERTGLYGDEKKTKSLLGLLPPMDGKKDIILSFRLHKRILSSH